MTLNGAQLHLLVNHLPVVGYPICLAAGLLAARTANNGLRHFAVGLAIVVSLGNLAAYFTGEGAEHVLKALGDLPRSYIHPHEEAAEIASILSGILLLCSLLLIPATARIAPALARPQWQRALRGLFLILLAVMSADLAYVAHLGGLIRHVEIRADAGN